MIQAADFVNSDSVSRKRLFTSENEGKQTDNDGATLTDYSDVHFGHETDDRHNDSFGKGANMLFLKGKCSSNTEGGSCGISVRV